MARTKSKSVEPAQELMKNEIVKNSDSETNISWQDIKYFRPKEFTCKCNGYCDHSDCVSRELAAKLDKIRDFIGKPLVVTSGTRCEKYNRTVNGSLGSAHIPKNGVSHAADIKCPDSEFRFAFLMAALPIFNRIGIGKDFIHVDDDPARPAGVVWLY